MDKLPRLRRKPKPPAIETSVRTDAHGGFLHQLSPNAVATVAATAAPSPSLSVASPFRSLRIRASAKRARGSASPAHSPAVTIFPTRSSLDSPLLHPLPPASSRPEMPGFLALSTREMDRRYQEITWAERLRLADAHSNQAVDDYKWGHYQQLDGPVRGFMDRYPAIRPWNHNRVRLRVPAGEFDYVNASTVVLPSSTGSSSPRRYIAMQGPTEPSVDYVWRMVAEQVPSPAVIVQLTSMEENGMSKCHRYFPDAGDGQATWTLNEGDVWHDGWSAQLTFVSRRYAADGALEVRKLLLDVDGEDETRVVWHFLYRCWPDFGVPSLHHMNAFFDLMRLSRQYAGAGGPRIIHCSAGVGRTGTLICLEHLMRELDGGALDDNGGGGSSAKNPDPVMDAVEALRQQRRGMVQGEIQYRFLYQVLRRLWRRKHGLSSPDDDDDDDGGGGGVGIGIGGGGGGGGGVKVGCDGEPAPKRMVLADPFTDDDDNNKTTVVPPEPAAAAAR
ncbi:hypothetical protein L249_7592 [Ophiocordyceps polyrhachis-furcata BCC 54312]|uniref:Tyrosine specific protein phosphatases domain-containing protein n=1 Tax=Ophiocordyceps polyrhachis-furcata BCC 54312 TaxID=1330021 RepID=A0A367LA46_9HYPO|nr:hypothetical protein L249_7592 [Ophiocordyceps polyrhachis-furcata BCC 54312]